MGKNQLRRCGRLRGIDLGNKYILQTRFSRGIGFGKVGGVGRAGDVNITGGIDRDAY